MALIRLREGVTLELHPFRAAFWREGDALLVADLHLGKARHFRRSGIAVPQGVSDANWDRLISLLIDWHPGQVVFLGDLFHSSYNAEWEHLAALREQFGGVRFILVRGNHDILSDAHYRAAGIELWEEPWACGPLLFSHHPMKVEEVGEAYNLSGHIHPAVTLRGAGRQANRLPCFLFGPRAGILPAFGAFTGHARIRPGKSDRVFVLTDRAVIEV